MFSDPALKTVLAIGFGPTASDDMPKRSPNSTPNNPTGGAASMINSRAANGETAKSQTRPAASSGRRTSEKSGSSECNVCEARYRARD